MGLPVNEPRPDQRWTYCSDARCGNLQLEVGPSTGLVQSKDRNQQRARPDEKELQHFIKDGRAQTAQGHINRNRQRRNPDAEINVPSQHDLHDLGHGKHVDAAHEHGHEGERNRGQGAGRFAETQFQISRHRVGFGDVVERHHDQRQEQHRRDGADPIPMRRQNAVLVGRTRPAHQFERPQIGREKTQACHPRRHLPPCHEKVFAGIGSSPQIKANPQHQSKVESNNDHIHRGQMHEPGCDQHGHRHGSLFLTLQCLRRT